MKREGIAAVIFVMMGDHGPVGCLLLGKGDYCVAH